MRALRKNMQKMWYALQKDVPTSYKTDGDEPPNVVIDGEIISLESGDKEPEYNAPVSFMANIHGTFGEADAVRYGVSESDYDAYIYAPKGKFPFSETTLIWYGKEPTFLDDESEKVDPDSADYIVKRIPVVLDESVFLLKRRDHE